MALHINATTRSAFMDAITTRAGSGALLQIFDGTPSVAPYTSTTVKLAQCTMGNSFAAAASNGVLTLSSIGSDSSADATGVATWFRIYASNASTIVMDGTVTATGGGGDLTLDNTTITAGGTVAITGTPTITAGNP